MLLVKFKRVTMLMHLIRLEPPLALLLAETLV